MKISFFCVEFEKIEDMILKHCIELKEGKVTEKIHQEAKKEEQPIKPKEQKATMGTLNFLD